MAVSVSVRAERRRLMASVASRAIALVPTALMVGVSLASAAQAGTVNPVQSTTYNLTPANNPITFGSGTNINVTGGNAVYGGTAASWNVTNQGKLATYPGTIPNTSGDGVSLLTGTVNNQAGGTIIGARSGVYVRGYGNITNAGTISAAGSFGTGGVQVGSGVVNNQAGGVISGVEGVWVGVNRTDGAPVSVTNAGSITGSVTAVLFVGPGSVTNEAGGTISGGTGVGAYVGPVNVTNSGLIAGGPSPVTYGNGVRLENGGSIVNNASGVITSSATDAIYLSNGAGLVTNYGKITSSARYGIRDESYVTTITNAAGAIISGTSGVQFGSSQGNLSNAGTIQGTVSNPNDIFTGIGVVAGGGTITNATTGSISGGNSGILLFGSTTITNAGTISGATSDGIVGFVAVGASTINNLSTGVIQGAVDGVDNTQDAPLTLTNSGQVVGGQAGVVLSGGGVVTNQTGGVITGGSYGIQIRDGETFTVKGAQIFGGYVTNAGTITGSVDSVEFTGGGPNVLTLETGSVLNGAAVGSTAPSATNTLILQGSGEADNNFVNFNTLIAEGPGTWTLGGTSAFTNAQLTGGTLDVTGSLNDVDAGIEVTSASATLINSGTISSPNDGVQLDQGGPVTNQTGGSILGGTSGVYAKGGPATVTNAGTITGTTWNGVGLFAGGAVNNQTGGKISGGNYGVYIEGGDASVTNAGSITGVSTGVGLNGTNSSVDNSGSIVSTGSSGFGVYLKSGGGTVTNETGGYISSARSGVAIQGGVGTVTNSGVIQSTYRDGVFLGSGGSVTNNAGASIKGNYYGVVSLGAATVTNAGGITATSVDQGNGVAVVGGAATVNNQAGATISGSGGVYVYGGALTLTNAGSITGANANGVTALQGGSVQNSAGGSIAGGLYGVRISGGDASVTNAGSISGVVAGVSLAGANASVDNSGSIKASGIYGLGVYLSAGGTVTNEKGGYIGATGIGVAITGDGATLTNSGAIQGGYVGAALLGNGAQITNNAGATISGNDVGILAVGSVSLTNAGTISAPGGFGVAVIGAATIDNQAGGVINARAGIYASSGALTLTNAGTITATGPVGIAALNGATIDNEAGGSISGAVYGVVIEGGGTVTNAGAISGGTYSIVFDDAGANTLTLQTGSSLTGNVVGSDDDGATNALVLQGAGEADINFINFNTLTAQGTGTWVLGGTSTFGSAEVDSGLLVIDGALTAGATTVDGGNLQVGDAAHGGATLTSPVTVNTGGTLSGHGTVIGDVTNNGGTVEPGGTIGTLTINGDYTQSSTGTLAIQLTSAGSSRLVVTGTANLAGALLFSPISGVFRKGQIFDFLDAGAINGSFSTITFNGPQIFTVGQSGNSLLATVNVGNFALQGGTVNQRALVPAFNNYPVGLTDFDSLASAVIGMSPGAAQNQVVNELGSEIAPDLVTASRENVRSQLGGFIEQLGPRGSGEAGSADPVWLEAIGRFGSTSSDGNAHGFGDTTGGIAGGVQRDFGASTIGGAGAYQQTWLSLNGLPQNGNVATGSFGLYGEQRFGSFYADLGGLIGWDHNSETRFIDAAGADIRGASADFGGFSGGVTGLVGDRFAMSGGWTVEPRVGLNWTHVNQDGFVEHGAGGADLAVAGESQDAVESLLGARVSRVFGGGFSGDASLDWAHDFNDLTPRASESFAGVAGTGFTFDGVNPGRDAALLRAGANYKNGQTTFFARYDGSFSNRADDSQVSAGLKVAF